LVLKNALPHEIIEEYKPNDDLELQDALSLIDQVNKTIDKVILKICDDVADEVLKEN
jgi:hypothetical protein